MLRCCKSRRPAATTGGSNAVSLMNVCAKELGGTNVSLEGTTTSQSAVTMTRNATNTGYNLKSDRTTGSYSFASLYEDAAGGASGCEDLCKKNSQLISPAGTEPECAAWFLGNGNCEMYSEEAIDGALDQPVFKSGYESGYKSHAAEHHELYGVYEGNELPAGGSEISSAEACKAAIEKVNNEVSSGMPGYVYEGETSNGSLPKGCVLGQYSSKWDKFYAYYNTADTGSTKGGYTKLFNFAPGYKVTEAAKKDWQAGSNSCPDGTRQINNYDDCQAAASTLHAVHPSSVSGNAVKKRGEWDLPGGCHFDYNAQTVTFNPYAGVPKGGRPLICAESPSLDGEVKIRTPLEMARWAYIERNYVDPHTGLTQDIKTLKSF